MVSVPVCIYSLKKKFKPGYGPGLSLVTAVCLHYFIVAHLPCESPVHILAASIIIVGDMNNTGYTGRKGTARVNNDHTTAADPKITSPPYLSLKNPPMTCAGMYPQKNADMTAPCTKQK